MITLTRTVRCRVQLLATLDCVCARGRIFSTIENSLLVKRATPLHIVSADSQSLSFSPSIAAADAERDRRQPGDVRAFQGGLTSCSGTLIFPPRFKNVRLNIGAKGVYHSRQKRVSHRLGAFPRTPEVRHFRPREDGERRVPFCTGVDD